MYSPSPLVVRGGLRPSSDRLDYDYMYMVKPKLRVIKKS